MKVRLLTIYGSAGDTEVPKGWTIHSAVPGAAGVGVILILTQPSTGELKK